MVMIVMEKVNVAKEKLVDLQRKYPVLSDAIFWFEWLYLDYAFSTITRASVPEKVKEEVLEAIFQYYRECDFYRAAVLGERMGKPQKVIIQLVEKALEFDLMENPYPYSGVNVHASYILQHFCLDPIVVASIARRAYEKRMASYDVLDHIIAEDVVKPLL